ncbi:MAG TPA: cytoplasmic protein [Vicinamibacteria bacterium]|nr:cytoplasmic protein [Vicinamibacteria bacterium]
MVRARPAARPGAFERLQASALYCPRCGSAQPVRERLLLVLPDGELYEYTCAVCNTSVGKRTTNDRAPLIVAS